MRQLTQLVYVSRASQQFSADDLTQLLSKIRKKNLEREVTGMLLRDGGSFMQVLEGESDKLERLFEHIQKDSRHHNIVLIMERPVSKRLFPDWSMGFRQVSDEMLAELDGLNDFYSARTCLDSVDEGRATKIIDAFARGRWQ